MAKTPRYKKIHAMECGKSQVKGIGTTDRLIDGTVIR
jgi:hypothetical protein